MEAQISLLFAAAIGFSHAFEADHLAAVSSMATRRDSPWMAVKDGVYWGLGHTSTILIIGLLMIVGKMVIAEQTFSYLEAAVGIMLIGLGIYRLIHVNKERIVVEGGHHHRLAYGVGAIHGLAGSGVLMVMVMSQLEGVFVSFGFLVLFGLGSIVGMLLAAGVFSLPFSKRWMSNQYLQWILVIFSGLFCLVIGGKIIYENLIA